MENVFEAELSLISNIEIKEWTRATLNNAPTYFWTGPASSTGKYHPACTCKVGGLVVHTKRVVYIAERLCSGWGLVGIDRDIVIAAALLHDIAKVGKGSGSYTDYENHPLNAKKYFIPLDDKEGYIDVINLCIKYHMGLWTPASVKKPLTEYKLIELAVYTADYIATTKDLVTPKDQE